MSENWPWQEVELPDEWSVDAGTPNFTTVGVGPEDGRPVAILVDLGFHGWGKLSAEGTANLNLIAAAPDLLAALKGLRDMVDVCIDRKALDPVKHYAEEMLLAKYLSAADAAITRAEGEAE